MYSQENYDNYIFQILEVNKELIEKNNEEKGINIVIGTLKNIKKYYQQEYNNILDVNGDCVEDKDNFFNDYLPSPGVKVKRSFLGEDEDQDTDLKYAEFSTVRFLLQCRRLSQMMTQTWLDTYDNSDDSVNNLSNKDKRIKYMNMIFHLFNYKPSYSYYLRTDPSEPNSEKIIKQPIPEIIDDFLDRKQNETDILHVCSYVSAALEKKQNETDTSYVFAAYPYAAYTRMLISELELNSELKLPEEPKSLEEEEFLQKKRLVDTLFQKKKLVDTLFQQKKAYFLQHKQALILSLFLSGQAYIEDQEQKTLQRLNEPIFSTYELIWEYELDLSWDSYYAKREDIGRPGSRPIIRQPNTRVTLGLPARPDYKLLTDEEIEKWVYAEEEYAKPVDGQSEEDLSFYPEMDSPEWENKQVKNVFPPYPYIILSCS